MRKPVFFFKIVKRGSLDNAYCGDEASQIFKGFGSGKCRDSFNPVAVASFREAAKALLIK